MEIDAIVKQRHLLTHPFYRRWQKGKVPIEVLEEYARQYYHYEKSLPSYMEATVGHLPEGEMKDSLTRVLEDERSHPKPHAEMWLDFAAALGLSADEVKDSEPSPATRRLVGTYRALTERGSEEGLAAIYAYEGQFAEVAEEKADGLRRFYEVTDDKALAFFDLHSTLDVDHGRTIKEAVTTSDRSREAAHLALDAWWGMLDQFEALSVAA